jgi:hypothetical protein
MRLFQVKKSKIFRGGGHPLPAPHPLGAFGASMRAFGAARALRALSSASPRELNFPPECWSLDETLC